MKTLISRTVDTKRAIEVSIHDLANFFITDRVYGKIIDDCIERIGTAFGKDSLVVYLYDNGEDPWKVMITRDAVEAWSFASERAPYWDHVHVVKRGSASEKLVLKGLMP